MHKTYFITGPTTDYIFFIIEINGSPYGFFLSYSAEYKSRIDISVVRASFRPVTSNLFIC